MALMRHAARMGATGNTFKILVVKPERKREVEKYRRRWEGNIKVDLKEIWCE
jgi:hypothetical protein